VAAENVRRVIVANDLFAFLTNNMNRTKSGGYSN
jgi:hypothetical protein